MNPTMCSAIIAASLTVAADSLRTHDGLGHGAGQGIGQAIASALAERGTKVIATDLTPPHETVRRIGPTAPMLFSLM